MSLCIDVSRGSVHLWAFNFMFKSLYFPFHHPDFTLFSSSLLT
jgi:hypothetical protein